MTMSVFSASPSLPEFRRQGIGGRLIRQALDAAKAFGLHRVELTVRENNVVAIQLYKKFGFAVEGLQRKRIWSRASTKTWC